MTDRAAVLAASEARAWRRYRDQLAAAVRAVDVAHREWSGWAADVRQQREDALGIEPFTSEGNTPPELLADPVYGAALDIGQPYRDAIDALRRATEAADEWERQHPPQ